MRKAQVSSQVFIYIGAAVVAALILILGYKAISTVIDTFGRFNIDEFKSEFENRVESISRQQGSVKRFEYSLPDAFSEICFVDSRNQGEKFSEEVKNSQGLNDYPLIKGSVQSDSSPNVFLMKDKSIEESFYVENLDVRENFMCTQASKFTVWLAGKGKTAELYNQNG